MDNNVFDLDHIKNTYFKLAIPVVLGMAVTLIYNLADTFFISRTQNINLIAGVSLCSPLFTALMAFGNIYGQGGSSLMSRLLGSQDEESCKRVSSFCFYVAIATGLVLAVILTVVTNSILKMIGTSADTIGYAREYYRYLVLGAPIIVLNFIHMNLLRCEGLSANSMVGTITGAVVNIILDPILISYMNMGAKGAAIATVIGYLCSDLYLLYIATHKSKFLSVEFKKAYINSNEFGQIMGIGFSAAVTNLMSSVCVVLMNNLLVNYGTDKIAAMGIVSRVNMIAQLALVGFAFGGVPLFGYLFGAHNDEKLKELLSFVVKFLVGLALGLSAILIIFAPVFINIFVKDSLLIAEASKMLRFQASGAIFVAIVLLMTVLFQATGKVIPAFCCSLSRQGIIYVIVLFIAVKVASYTGLLASQCLADVISAAMGLMLYKFNFK